jgi:hypothetical protein
VGDGFEEIVARFDLRADRRFGRDAVAFLCEAGHTRT